MKLVNRAILGDCFEEMEKMEDNSVYCTITDFPYGECSGFTEGGYKRLNRDLADKDASGEEFDFVRATKEIIRVTKGSCFIFCGFEQVSEIIKTMRNLGLNMTRIITWEKPNSHVMNCDKGFLSTSEVAVFGRKSGAYWGGKYERSTIVQSTLPLPWHPTAKPIPLLKKLVGFMCPEGETVFDCCAGSFGTAVAAHEMGRAYYCVEKNPEFYNKAMEYYEDRLKQELLF